MSEPRPISKFLLYFLGTAFGFFADRALNVLLPAPEDAAAAMLALCLALATALVAVYFFRTHLPKLSRQVNLHARSGALRHLSVPNLFTGSRLILAGFILLELFSGRITASFWLYLAGLLTDVLDGMIARSLKGATDWGKQFDAEVDAIFNAATGLGLLWICTHRGNLVEVALIASLFLIFVLRRLFSSTGHLAKYLSGLYRLVFVAIFLLLIPSADRLLATAVALAILSFGAWYEYRVMQLPEAPASPPLR